MKYCILKYEIYFNNNEKVNGRVPYRGESIGEVRVQSFVKSYFGGLKQGEVTSTNIEIEEIFEEPKEWLNTVKDWEEFKYLRRINNFCGDIMNKYFPNE
jgi:hypothetical protein